MELTAPQSCAPPTTDLCVVLMVTLIQQSVIYSWRSAALLEVSLRRAMGHAKVGVLNQFVQTVVPMETGLTTMDANRANVLMLLMIALLTMVDAKTSVI